MMPTRKHLSSLERRASELVASLRDIETALSGDDSADMHSWAYWARLDADGLVERIKWMAAHVPGSEER